MASKSSTVQSNGHPSRRDNHSISSNHSGSGRTERGTRTPSHPAVESAVTRLLVSIKQLLEALTLWSTLKMDENQVSDVYVRLGNDFNAAVAAFAAFNIDMTELLSVPDELRNVLEQCLAEDANPDNLELYLPNVRQIITNLLQGLRGKQSIYRRIVSDHRRRSEDPGHERQDSRSSRGERVSRREGHRSQLSRTVLEEERSSSVSRRGAVSRSVNSQVMADGDELVLRGSPSQSDEQDLTTTQITARPPEQQQQRKQLPMAPPVLQPSPPPAYKPVGRESPIPPNMSVNATVVPPPRPPPTSSPPPPPVPSNVKRYSLVDRPAPTPSVVIEPSSPDIVDQQHQDNSTPPPISTPPLPTVEPPPAVANSLAALKKNDVLERRASKRFSTYNISKMTGGGGGVASRSTSLRSHPNRRSLLAASNALTPGELEALTEVDDEEPDAAPLPTETPSRTQRYGSRPTTPSSRQGSVPPPRTPAKTPEPVLFKESQNGAQPHIVDEPPAPPPFTSQIMVFLQLGREVKKVVIEPGLSFSSLRVLFVDKFAYNPGLDNFPAIYIRDPSSGVQYELEDTDEVKEKCLLSLNIEPLDQIKQHIDAQISGLSQDLKDLKTVMANNNRQSAPLLDMTSHALAESTPNRPSDRQFQHIARRLSRFVGDSSITSPVFSSMSGISQMHPQMTGQSLQPQMTGGSVLSDYSNRVVTDLKTQFDEVQNLRRDLGIMRQLYTEFMKQTKESLGTLRTQTLNVKQLANSNIGGARAYIDSGKKKLDVRSQNVLTEVEKLQDTVEGIKDDVIKRQITPKATYLKNIKKDMETASAELESLKEHIKTIKPMWKKTWEEELQNIVEEQQFLTHQEEFLTDLLEDYKSVVEVCGHVEKVISLRGTTNGLARTTRGRGFKPPPPDENHNGLSTLMLEIRGAAVDPERRLKAIVANQKMREKELAARSDDLQAELTDFVGQKKLKMTGGAEETERVRQRRNELTLKAMFTGGGSGTASTTTDGRGDYFGDDTPPSPLTP